MKLTSISAAGLVLALVAGAQPRLKVKSPTSYVPGDAIDEATFVLDRQLQDIRLTDLIDAETQVAVLIIFGGGAAEAPGDEPLRGGLWCEDSYDDLALQRALLHHFKERPVQFIPVAVPPVYHRQFGYPEGVFLEHPDDHPACRRAAQDFVEATEKQRVAGVIPYPSIYYDPKFRLAQNRSERELGTSFGKIFEWQGKLKWHQDPRTYGTPTIWLLDNQLRVLSEPFFGNDYDGDPPQINYGFHDVRKRIEEHLEQKESARMGK